MLKYFIPNPQDKSDVFIENVFAYSDSKGYECISIGSCVVNRFGKFDYELTINYLPVAIFKKWNNDHEDFDDCIKKLSSIVGRINYKLVVLVIENEYLIINEESYSKVSFDELMNTIQSIVENKNNYPDVNFDLAKNVISDFVKRNNLHTELIKREHLFGWSVSPQYITLKNKKLPSQIVRYTSLGSFFHMINNMSFRMNALPGMNDKTEGGNLTFEGDSWWTQERNVQNTSLIVSFSDICLEDDLTQWRLYGDNARGVCCVFDVDENKLGKDFILQYIVYSDSLLKKLYELQKKLKRINDLFTVDLTQFKCFVKPKDFKVEKEVRLLRNEDSANLNWLITNGSSIVNAYIDIEMKNMPLKLTKVILGPNMPNQEVNILQIQYMLAQMGYKDYDYEYFNGEVDVVPSKIKCYR